MNGTLCGIFTPWKHLFRVMQDSVLLSICFFPVCVYSLDLQEVVTLFLLENDSAVEGSFHVAAPENVAVLSHGLLLCICLRRG